MTWSALGGIMLYYKVWRGSLLEDCNGEAGTADRAKTVVARM